MRPGLKSPSTRSSIGPVAAATELLATLADAATGISHPRNVISVVCRFAAANHPMSSPTANMQLAAQTATTICGGRRRNRCIIKPHLVNQVECPIALNPNSFGRTFPDAFTSSVTSIDVYDPELSGLTASCQTEIRQALASADHRPLVKQSVFDTLKATFRAV